MHSRTFHFVDGLWLSALLFANVAVLFADALPLKAASIVLLTGLLPGIAGVYTLFPAQSALDRWERLGLGYALGFLASLQMVWYYMLVPGRMQVPVLLLLLDAFTLVLGLAALWQRSRTPTTERPVHKRLPGRETLIALFLLTATAFLLFANLGYTEYDYDETPVVSDAVATILGNDAAVFSLRKGPEQIVIATTYAMLGGSVAEGFMRIPFALAGVATALLFWRLARRLLGASAALAALALWSAEGMHLGENRWVQYQGILLLTSLCAIFCFVRAASLNGGVRRRFQLAGTFAFAAGLLTHYDGAFIAPVLGLMWLWMQRDSLRQWRTWVPAGVLAAAIALIAAPFYLALTQQGGAAAYFNRYFFGLRVGNGPFNMMSGFFQRMAVLDAPAWIVLTSAGLSLAGLLIGWRLWRRRRRIGVLWFALLATAAGAAILPNALVVGDLNLSFVPYSGLLLILALVPAAGLPARLLAIWALCSWIFPAFWMQVPGDHYFLSLPALTLLAAWSLGIAIRLARRRGFTQVVQRAVVAASAGAVVSSIAFVYLMLVSSQPEYVMQYPEAAPWPLALFVGDRPVLIYGAYPHQSGWRVVALLYERGVLHGEYQSNEMHAVADWYLAVNWWPQIARPRYYLEVLHPFAPILASEVPADLAQTHWLIGQITVAGEPRMLVYQQRDAGLQPSMQNWAAESLDAEWQNLTSLERFTAYRDAGRDDTAFYAVARRVGTDGRNGDAVMLDGPLGRSLLARYYSGNLPLLTSFDDQRAMQAQRLWGVYWASPNRAVEREVAVRACPATMQWYQNVRLTLNGIDAYAAPISVEATLADIARLHSVAFGEHVTPATSWCVRLDWETLKPTAVPYKLFIHVIDATGKVVAQADTQPLSGLKPSTEWRPNDRFADQTGISLPPLLPPGTYRVLAGLYSEGDGTRIIAVSEDGTHYPDDAVKLGSVTVR
jgi:4-amino-4-deoxy-L-arabinose transferase-like glycosyltransferase